MLPTCYQHEESQDIPPTKEVKMWLNYTYVSRTIKCPSWVAFDVRVSGNSNATKEDSCLFFNLPDFLARVVVL